MNIIDKLKNTQVSPKLVMLCIGVFVVLATTGILTVKRIVSGPAEPLAVATSSTSTAGTKSDAAEKTSAAVDGSSKEDAKVSVTESDPCEIIADRNLFKSFASGKVSAPAKPVGGTPPLIPPMPIRMLPPFPGGGGFPGFGGPPRGGSEKLAFTGVVETPDGIQALIENTATSETKFAGVGESAFGSSVVSINSRSVTLDSGGRIVTLAIGENKADAPAAPPNPGTPGQPQPGDTPPAGVPQPQMGPGAVPPMPMPNMEGNRGGRGRRGMRG